MSHLSDVFPWAFRKRGGALLRHLGDALDHAWQDLSRPQRARWTSPTQLATLARGFGWGGVLATFGDLGEAARPEMLCALPAGLANGSQTCLAFWFACLFDHALIEAHTVRTPPSPLEVGPPCLRLVVCGPARRFDRPRMGAVARRLTPAHLHVVPDEIHWRAPATAQGSA